MKVIMSKYKVSYVDEDNLQEVLNKESLNGWELVSISPKGSKTKYLVIFKSIHE